MPIPATSATPCSDLNAMLDEEPNADLPRGGRFADWMRQIDAVARGRAAASSPTATTPSCRSTPSSGCGRSSRDRGQLDDTIVTTGVGQHQMWAAQYFHFNKPRHWLTSGGLGTMGFGLPAAMGAQAAHPDKLVIDIDGDGSFLMNIQELATAYTEKLPVKVLLLNNQHLGMVVQWEDRFYERQPRPHLPRRRRRTRRRTPTS